MKLLARPWALSLAAFTFLAAGCSKPASPPPAPELPAVSVRVHKAHLEEIASRTDVIGTVRPVQRATIAAKVMGTIAEMRVALGQAVKQGDILVEITAAEIAARVAQAQAQLNQAKRDLGREQTLLEQKASTADMVKSLEDRVAMTEAMVREAEVMRGYTTITAPFAGVVARKHAEAGDLAAPGLPLLELEGDDAFEIEAGIPDSLTKHVTIGIELEVLVPSTTTSFTAQLIELSSATDGHARTVLAKLAVPSGTPVRSGQFARVRVPGESAQALMVPASAVTTLGQMDRVFVVVDGRAVLRLVKIGEQRDTFVEILSGLDGGEDVVIDPPATLREGQALEIRP